MPPRRRRIITGLPLHDSSDDDEDQTYTTGEDDDDDEDDSDDEPVLLRNVDTPPPPRARIFVDMAVSAEDEDEDEDDSDDEPVLLRNVDTPPPPRAEDMVVEAEDKEEEEGGEWSREDIDGLFCVICMEPWSSTGIHLPSCLSCGHMFGMSCIKKWLGQCKSSSKPGKCPQCNKKCTLKDIRRVYGSRVVVVDEESQKRIKFLEAKCHSFEKKDKEWRKKEAEWRAKELNSQKREAKLLQKFEALKERTSNLERSVEELEFVGNKIWPKAAGQSSSGHKLGLNHSPVSPGLFELQQDVKLEGARFFDVDHVGQMLVIARRPTSIDRPHLLTKMSLLAPNEQDDIFLPPTVKSVRDVHVSPSGRLALLASMGKKLSVVSLESNNIVVNYDLPVAAWSCSWDSNNSNHVYAGLQDGTVFVFDLRQTERPLESRRGLTWNPVHSMYSLSEDSTNSSGTKNLLTASSVGLCLWNIGGTEERPTLVDQSTNRGICISLACSQSTDDVVATFRPKVEIPDDNSTTQVSQTQTQNMGQSVHGSHVLFQRRNSMYQSFVSAGAFVPGIRLPKSAILGIEPNKSVFTCGDDSTSNLTLQELPLLRIGHCLESNYPVRDTKYVTSTTPNLLCCLSEGGVQLFRKKLS